MIKIEFKRYQDVNEFIEENMELILKKEWLNNLMVGNIKDAKIKGIDESWILARVTKNNKTELIIFKRDPWKLLLYSPTENKDDELYKFAAEEIYKIESNLIGVNTEKDIGEKFAKEYCKIANKEYKLHLNMRILVLEELTEPNLREDVVFRKAQLKDKEILKQFVKEFHKEGLNEELSEERLEKDFYEFLEKGYYVLEKDGKIVAQTVVTRKLEKGKSVSEVYTPKEERCNGYAYNLIYRVSKEFLDSGAEYCVLFTDDGNPISNHVYEKIGYRRKVDTSDIDFI